MKSTHSTVPSANKEKSIATISKQVKPIPTQQLLKLKGGGNPWIDAS
ncbi:MAG: hypothetical protein KTR30_38955 [Saprospiraceae bacterium]|nr:hypothetical protein [Saprospiraceae bacterium]